MGREIYVAIDVSLYRVGRHGLERPCHYRLGRASTPRFADAVDELKRGDAAMILCAASSAHRQPHFTASRATSAAPAADGDARHGLACSWPT